jgi:hypothetical protein
MAFGVAPPGRRRYSLTHRNRHVPPRAPRGPSDGPGRRPRAPGPIAERVARGAPVDVGAARARASRDPAGCGPRARRRRRPARGPRAIRPPPDRARTNPRSSRPGPRGARARRAGETAAPHLLTGRGGRAAPGAGRSGGREPRRRAAARKPRNRRPLVSRAPRRRSEIASVEVSGTPPRGGLPKRARGGRARKKLLDAWVMAGAHRPSAFVI